jgi:hypothetical protein
MNERQGTYDVTAAPGAIRRTCFLRFSDQNWTKPTSAEVRELIKRLDMSGAEVANFVGAGTSRTVRRWTADPEQPNYREISYAAWRLLVERYARQLKGLPLDLDLAEALTLAIEE